jgi:release factor glutamine methyltransferase
MTVGEALQEGSRRIGASGAESAPENASSLLRFVLGWDLATLLTYPERILSPREERAYLGLVEERASRKPLQHITGRQAFWHHEFRVSPDVLIPRPETEILVEAALSRLEGRKEPLVADIGTGSGCIALSLAAARDDLRVHAVDLSEAALDMARLNAQQLGLSDRVTFHHGDLMGPLEHLAHAFDLVASNPPYVAEDEIDRLAPEVRLFEPRMALVAPGDRTSLYRRLLPEAASALKDGGHLLLEIGAGMEGEVVPLLAGSGFEEPEILPDLQAIPRTIAARYRPRRPSH